MTSVAAVMGLFAVIGTAGAVFVWTRVFGPITRELRDEFSFDDRQIDVGFETVELIRSIAGHDLFIVLISSLVFFVPIVNSRWSYLRYKAEAQATVALSEIADGPKEAKEIAAVPTGRTLLVASCTWALPVIFSVTISTAFFIIVWTPKSLKMDLKLVEDSNLVVLEFDTRAFKFQNFDVELKNRSNETVLDGFSHRPFHPDYFGFCFGSVWVLDLSEEEPVSASQEHIFEAPIIVEDVEEFNLAELLSNPDVRPVSAEISWTTAYGSTGVTTSNLSLDTLPQAPGNAMNEACFGF